MEKRTQKLSKRELQGEYVVRSRTATWFLEVLRKDGWTEAHIREKFVLPMNYRAFPEVRMSIDSYRQLTSEVAQVTRDPWLGFHVSQMVSIDEWPAIKYLCRTASTVEHAFRRFSTYVALLTGGVQANIRKDVRWAWLLNAMTNEPLHLGPQGNQVVLTIWIRLLREVLGPDWSPHIVQFAHPHDGSDYSEFQRFAGTTDIQFDMGQNALAMVRDELERPLMPEITLENQMTRVREAVISSLAEGTATLPIIAKEIGTSPRTLQRTLQKSNTSFQELLTSVRQEMSTLYLAESTLTLDDVAYLLGYSDYRPFLRTAKKHGIDIHGLRALNSKPLIRAAG